MGDAAATGQQPQREWCEGNLWGKRAETLAQYLTKGTLVTVALEDTHIETFRKQDNTEGVKLVARITAIELAGGAQQQAPAQPKTPPQQRPAQRQAAPAIPAGGGFEDMADDVPF